MKLPSEVRQFKRTQQYLPRGVLGFEEWGGRAKNSLQHTNATALQHSDTWSTKHIKDKYFKLKSQLELLASNDVHIYHAI